MKSKENALTDAHARDRIKANNGWVMCPHCRRKLLRLFPDTEVVNLPVLCRHCHNETIVNIPNAPAPES